MVWWAPYDFRQLQSNVRFQVLANHKDIENLKKGKRNLQQVISSLLDHLSAFQSTYNSNQPSPSYKLRKNEMYMYKIPFNFLQN